MDTFTLINLFDFLKKESRLILKKTLFIFTISLLIATLSYSQDQNTIPPYLKKGDTIAIVAPAGILKPSRGASIEKAKSLFESWGLHVMIGKHVFAQNHHFAGTDAERAADFQNALDDPSIKAIIAARGGYGSVRILDALDFTKFKAQPKWIVGYSDLTAFHNHIHNLGVETLHAMMATSVEFDDLETKESISTLKKALFGEALSYQIPASEYNRKGRATGELVGGNLALLASMLGSKSQIKTDGKILFIEEIGEYKYAIDRMLQSLKRAGYFQNVKAVIVGDMSMIKKNTTPWGSSIESLILAVLPEDIPVLFDFPAGHEADNRALIMGRKISLKIEENIASVSF